MKGATKAGNGFGKTRRQRIGIIADWRCEHNLASSEMTLLPVACPGLAGPGPGPLWPGVAGRPGIGFNENDTRPAGNGMLSGLPVDT